MTVLADFQHEIGGVVLGAGTAYPLARVEGLGKAPTRAQDSAIPGDDGVFFGVDHPAAREPVYEGGVKAPGDPAGALDALAALSAAWDPEVTRLTPGGFTSLRIKLPGRGTRVLFGRPRRFDPDLELLSVGWVPFVATFVADPKFYDDLEQQVVLPVGVIGARGLAAPVAAPISFGVKTAEERPSWVHNAGSARTWPVVRFTGPCVNPSVTNTRTGARLEVRTSLLTGERVDIDTRPWARSVLRNGSNAVGALSPASRLERFWLEAGAQEIRYAAQDNTNTSRMTLTWRSAWTSL